MQTMPKLKFPAGSLLAAMLGTQAPVDVRRAAQRLRAEAAPALAADDGIAGLAHGLAAAEIAHSPAVLDALPPIFWLEAQQAGAEDARGTSGWVVEKKAGGLAARGFAIAAGRDAVPMPQGTVTLPFGPRVQAEDAATAYVRGLVTAISLPEMFAQMGETSPVLLMPAEAPEDEASTLRGFQLSIAIPPDAAPG